MDVVCTAGHVDHGKSSLVRAMTGMEPDRFAEERRRGLTIDIGFGWTRVGDGAGARTIAFVDLPGHDRFIANMLAGAGPVEAALFVVAADEGWKPQTQEHLDILDLLEVSAAVVALTKSDLVDAERILQVRADVEARLSATSLAGAPIVAVSAATSEGLDRLREALVGLLERRPPPSDRGRPRLWVDRTFSVKGAGTVVTGTLTGGVLRQGDEVVILPRGVAARVRGMESLKSAVAVAEPGHRVAVNLAGVDLNTVGRGDVVALPGREQVTREIDVWLRVLPGRRVGRRGAWHLHAGSGEWLVQVRPVTGEISGEGFARMLLRTPAALTAGDRFVLRDAGPRTTAAGGLVVDAAALRRRSPSSERLERRRAALADGRSHDLLAEHVRDRGAAPLAEAAAAAGLAPRDARAAAREGGLLSLGPAVADPAAAARWSAAIEETLLAYHREHPVERVAPRAVAGQGATAAGCPTDLVPALLDVLVAVRRLVVDGPGIRHPGHTVQLDAQQVRARDALLARLNRDPLQPPNLSVAAADAGASTSLVRELEAEGSLVRIAPDLALSRAALDRAVEILRAAAAQEGALTTSRARELLGTSRKYAIPLLELLDRRGVTRRTGDTRTVL